MKKIIFLSALLVMLSSTAGAQSNGVNMVTTIGNPDCGEWIKNPSNTQKTWLLGFLSGQSVVFNLKTDPVSLVSATQAFLWMDNHCKANPLSDVGKGAKDLFVELMANALKKK